MERSGMSIQVIPMVDGSGDHGFLVSHTLWEGGQCQQTRIVLNESVHLTNQLSGRPDNLLWMLDILEVASQLVQRVAGPKPQASFTPANDRYRDTTEKPFLS